MTSPTAISPNEWQNLFRFAYCLCQQREDALSLLHGAIERLLRVKTTQPLRLDYYLRQVIRHLHYSRNQRPLPYSHPVTKGPSPDATCPALEDLVMQPGADVWQTLNTEQRDLMYLWAWLDFSPEQMAAELNVARNKVQGDLQQLREQLLRRGAKVEQR